MWVYDCDCDAYNADLFVPLFLQKMIDGWWINIFDCDTFVHLILSIIHSIYEQREMTNNIYMSFLIKSIRGIINLQDILWVLY